MTGYHGITGSMCAGDERIAREQVMQTYEAISSNIFNKGMRIVGCRSCGNDSIMTTALLDRLFHHAGLAGAFEQKLAVSKPPYRNGTKHNDLFLCEYRVYANLAIKNSYILLG